MAEAVVRDFCLWLKGKTCHQQKIDAGSIRKCRRSLGAGAIAKAISCRISNSCSHTLNQTRRLMGANKPDDGEASYFKILELLKEESLKNAKLESLLLRFGSKKYPNGANGCCCLFDDDDNQIQWCAPHADLRDKVVKLEGWLKLIARYSWPVIREDIKNDSAPIFFAEELSACIKAMEEG